MKREIDIKRISTYKDLMKTIQKSLYTAWGKDKVTLVSAYPSVTTSEIKLPIITYMSKKTPGMFSKDSEIKPRVRGQYKTQDEDGKDVTLNVMGQIFDLNITFEIWAANGTEADDLAEDFEKFMAAYSQYFIKCGISNILFTSRNDEQSQHQWKTDLIKRSISYQFVIDQITSLELENINGIAINTVVYSNIFEMLTAENIIKNVDEL